MQIFTYRDYIRYQQFIKQNNEEVYVSNHELRENEEEYHSDTDEIYHEHDKIFRKILDNKQEAAKLIYKAIKYEIQANQIEQYNSSFITEKLENRESDIVYRMKEKNIFFLIEHQTKIDYSMPYRILEYEYQIMKSAIDKKRLGQKEYQIPMVIAIVLYTGRKKWNAKTYLQEMQERLPHYRGMEMGKYNIVDVNNYTEQELLEEESFYTKAMLIERARYTKKMVDYLLGIIEEMNKKKDIYTKEQKELFKTIVNLTIKKKLTVEDIKKINEKLQERGEENMLAVLEMIEEENKRIFAQGERKGKKQNNLEIAKKMLEEKIPIKTIMKITGLKQEEILKNHK